MSDKKVKKYPREMSYEDAIKQKLEIVPFPTFANSKGIKSEAIYYLLKHGKLTYCKWHDRNYIVLDNLAIEYKPQGFKEKRESKNF